MSIELKYKRIILDWIASHLEIDLQNRKNVNNAFEMLISKIIKEPSNSTSYDFDAYADDFMALFSDSINPKGNQKSIEELLETLFYIYKKMQRKHENVADKNTDIGKINQATEILKMIIDDLVIFGLLCKLGHSELFSKYVTAENEDLFVDELLDIIYEETQSFKKIYDTVFNYNRAIMSIFNRKYTNRMICSLLKTGTYVDSETVFKMNRQVFVFDHLRRINFPFIYGDKLPEVTWYQAFKVFIEITGGVGKGKSTYPSEEAKIKDMIRRKKDCDQKAAIFCFRVCAMLGDLRFINYPIQLFEDTYLASLVGQDPDWKEICKSQSWKRMLQNSSWKKFYSDSKWSTVYNAVVEKISDYRKRHINFLTPKAAKVEQRGYDENEFQIHDRLLNFKALIQNTKQENEAITYNDVLAFILDGVDEEYNELLGLIFGINGYPELCTLRQLDVFFSELKSIYYTGQIYLTNTCRSYWLPLLSAILKEILSDENKKGINNTEIDKIKKAILKMNLFISHNFRPGNETENDKLFETAIITFRDNQQNLQFLLDGDTVNLNDEVDSILTKSCSFAVSENNIGLGNTQAGVNDSEEVKKALSCFLINYLEQNGYRYNSDSGLFERIKKMDFKEAHVTIKDTES